MDPISYRPDLPDFGIYLRWPMDGDDWIHPDDLELARQLIPSRRVLSRQRWDGEYYHLHYGHWRLRVKPSMWLRVPDIDLEVGQQVELLSCHFRNDPAICRLTEILYCPVSQRFQFYLRGPALKLVKTFNRDDLRPLHVRHELREGYYQHPPTTAQLPQDLELLNVGDLTAD